MRQPEEGNPFVAVAVRVQQENDITLADLLVEIASFLWQCRRVDNRCGHIVGRANRRRYTDLWKGGLYLIRHEGVLD